MKKLLLFLLGLVAALLLAAVVHTVLVTPRRPVIPHRETAQFDVDAAARRLGQALQFRTESLVATIADGGAEFDRFHAFLAQSFPLVHSRLKLEPVNRFSLLYTWPGKNPALKPALLMCHQDVVPISPGTEKDWKHAPYSGDVAEGFIWGRGALDVKSGLMGQLEAVERLLADGFQPERTLYLAFGHDEEIGGLQGAARIAALLKSRGIELESVLDEGGQVTVGVLPGVQPPVAMIGVAEKGYITLTLTAKVPGGHSSMPEHTTAIGVLSRAIARLEANPFPADLTHVNALNRHIAAGLPWPQRVVVTNPWLFGPLIERIFARTGTTDAMQRTTTAPTIIAGGNKDNVLPPEAMAKVNFRPLPGVTKDQLIARVQSVIADPRVEVAAYTGSGLAEASPVSDTESASYRLLERTIYETLPEPDAIVTPYLCMGGTDAHHYIGLSHNVYRFVMNRYGPADLKLFHGTNERISVANYGQVVAFYHRLIQNMQQP
jgi:carboxypeptidase PM20D1